MSYPCQPCCGQSEVCPNCTFASRPTEFVLDFGAGGWTEENCTYCDQVAGEFTLARSSVCIWVYYLAEPCGYTSTVFIWLQIETVAPDSWRWKAWVVLDRAAETEATAVYYSDTTDESDCWYLGGTSDSDKLTLTKDSDADGTMCDGALPGTIEMWKP